MRVDTTVVFISCLLSHFILSISSHESASFASKAHDSSSQRVFSLFLRGAQGSEEGVCKQKFFVDQTDLISSLVENHPGLLFLDYLVVNGLLDVERNYESRFFDRDKYSNPSIVKRAFKHKGINHDIHHIFNVLKFKNENYSHPKREFLENLKKKSFADGVNPAAQISKLNIVCYSMGCLTALKLAHRMQDDSELNHIKINLFLIDPVGGAIKRKNHSYLTVADNVDSVIEVVATNEKSVFFEPIVPRISNEKTKFRIYNMPGNHLNIIGHCSLDHPWDRVIDLTPEKLQQGERMFRPVISIIRDLAEKFLLSHGTELRERLQLGREHILLQYSRIRENIASYKKCEKDSFTFFKSHGQRKAINYGSYLWFLPRLSKMIDFDFHTEEYFVNLHHKEVYESMELLDADI